MKKQVENSVLYIQKEIERRSPSNNLIILYPDDLKEVPGKNDGYCRYR